MTLPRAERGITVDLVTIYRWVLRFTPELVPSALYTVEQHANNPIEADHGRLKAPLRRKERNRH